MKLASLIFTLLIAYLIAYCYSEVPNSDEDRVDIYFSRRERAQLASLLPDNVVAVREAIGKRLKELEHDRQQTRLLAKRAGEYDMNCTCECIIRPFWEPVNYGYGKYCGAVWTCNRGDLGCDELDSCCRSHDFCVDAAGGYCHTCPCNLALATCSSRIPPTALGFCGKEQQALAGVLEDICFVIRFAPSECGGCPSGTVIPPVCYNVTLLAHIDRLAHQ